MADTERAIDLRTYVRDCVIAIALRNRDEKVARKFGHILGVFSLFFGDFSGDFQEMRYQA